MSSTRLTKAMRENIRNALMARAYVERKEEVANLEHELGMAVYNDKYSHKHQALMKRLPEEFFNRKRSIHAAFDGDYYSFTIRESVLSGYHHAGYYALGNYPADHELTKAFLKFKKLKEEYEHDSQCLIAEASSILASCSTVKKLIETWPEIEPVLQKLNISPVQIKEVHLPAVIQDMNALFSLPPDGSSESGDNQALAA